MKEYFTVRVNCNEEEKDLLQHHFIEAKSLGLEEVENGFISYYLTEDQAQVFETIEQLKNQYHFDYSSETIAEQNWNKIWESEYKPTFVGDYCAVYAPFHQKLGSFKHEIVINPEMAFGTGHHETTQLMLTQMQELSMKNKSVLDLGSGTGILAIVASKEGAEPVVAVDIDEQAYKIMKENFVKNGVERIKAIKGTAETVKPQFDLILANINRNVLLNESQLIVDRLSNNALLIISGFYSNDGNMLSENFSKLGLKEINRKEKNKWCSLIFRN